MRATLAIDAAVAGTRIIYHFEDWLRPDPDALKPIVEPWWVRFPGPHYHGRRLVPAPVRAFVACIKSSAR